MAVQAWFERGEVAVRPGESRTLALTVENLGESTESLTILPSGTTAGWVTVVRPTITLFGATHDTVEVVVRPPAAPTTTAGPSTLTMRVVPLVDPDDTAMAEVTLLVESFDDRRISMLQPLQRARRRATFELMVENHGNQLASCRLHLVDPSNRVDGTFDPPAVGVPPGGSTLVMLRLHATSVMFRRRDRQLDFEIEATQSDHEPAVVRAALIQPPTIPGRLLARAVAVGAVAALAVGAWFGVIRPELRDAAQRAVDDRIAELSPGGPADDDVIIPPSGSGTVPPATPVDEGAPFTVRLPLQLAVGATGSDSSLVPDQNTLLLTDVVVQNPNADRGVAALLRNSDVIYQWDLGAMTSANEFQPRVAPLEVGAGDELVFRATCSGAGTTTGTGCDVAVLLGGRLVAAD